MASIVKTIVATGGSSGVVSTYLLRFKKHNISSLYIPKQ